MTVRAFNVNGAVVAVMFRELDIPSIASGICSGLADQLESWYIHDGKHAFARVFVVTFLVSHVIDQVTSSLQIFPRLAVSW